MKKLLWVLFTAVVTVALATSFGSIALGQIQETDIVLVISPQNPGPNQNVKASLGSYAIDLDKANISWSVNGEELARGIGKKSVSFKTSSSNSSTTLSVNIDSVDGQSISKTAIISGAGVDLLWEAYDAYTPPFYRGKTMVPSEGKFKVVAVPNFITQGEKANAGNLSYNWTLDDNPKTSLSGWGKSWFIFQNSYLDKSNTVEAEVSDIYGETKASGKITLKTHSPKILFYENDPSLGIKWENALSDGSTISQSGTSIIAEPYYFSPQNINSPYLSFEWYLGGRKIETPQPKNVLYVRPEGGKSGRGTIKLLVENTDTLFQTLEKTLKVQF